MRSRDLGQLVNDKSVKSVTYMLSTSNLLSTGLKQVVSTSNKSANYKLVSTSLILSDLLQLYEMDKLFVDKLQQAVKFSTWNKSVAFLVWYN